MWRHLGRGAVDFISTSGEASSGGSAGGTIILCIGGRVIAFVLGSFT